MFELEMFDQTEVLTDLLDQTHSSNESTRSIMLLFMPTQVETIHMSMFMGMQKEQQRNRSLCQWNHKKVTKRRSCSVDVHASYMTTVLGTNSICDICSHKSVPDADRL